MGESARTTAVITTDERKLFNPSSFQLLKKPYFLRHLLLALFHDTYRINSSHRLAEATLNQKKAGDICSAEISFV
jgi:hypothetical protein